MSLKHWNWINRRLEEPDTDLAELLTLKEHYVLIGIPKPENQWNIEDRFVAKSGRPVTTTIAMNHGSTDTTYLYDPTKNQAYYLKGNEFKRISSPCFNDWDKTQGHRYVYEGSFQEFKQELEQEGFKFEE